MSRERGAGSGEQAPKGLKITARIRMQGFQGFHGIRRPPTLAQKAVNLAGAVGDQVAGMARGKGWHRDPLEAARNLRICEECPAKLFNPKNGTCTHPRCGCKMKRKTSWSMTACPLGLWSREQGARGGEKQPESKRLDGSENGMALTRKR